MDKNNSFTIIKDIFRKEDTGEKVNGLTIIIDGKIKEVFDTIIRKSNKYDDYTSVLSEVMVQGMNKIINEI